MAAYIARSITQRRQSVTASTVAALAALYNKASSPNPLRCRPQKLASALLPKFHLQEGILL